MKRVACVVVLHDGAVLGVSRKDAPGDYVLPGGECNEALGEDLAETAARELKEKTGLTADPRTFVQLLRGVEPGSETQVTTFLARSYQGTIGSTELCAVCWVGWPALLRGAFGQYNARVRAALVDIDPDSWVGHYGSGSLRRAREENMRWREMYLAERTALEFGYGFQPVPSSRVAFGDALACGDDPGTTETCWWARALRFRAERSGLNAAITRATRAFEADDLLALANANENLQGLIDAAIARGRRAARYQAEDPTSRPEPSPGTFSPSTETEDMIKSLRDAIEESRRDRAQTLARIRARLLRIAPPETEGTWSVYGEDGNTCISGPREIPLLGHFRGTLAQVVEHALTLPRFIGWGHGGDVKPFAPAEVHDVHDLRRTR